MKIFALGSTLVGSSAINLIARRPSNLVITDFPVHCGSLRNTKIHKQIHIQMHAQASEHTIVICVHTNVYIYEWIHFYKQYTNCKPEVL